MQIEISCPERWREEWNRSQYALAERKITKQQSLEHVAARLMGFLCWVGADKVVVSPDFCAHCFLFKVYSEDDSCIMNGGIIFHGLPDTGYQQNGSVQLTPSYGWQIHT